MGRLLIVSNRLPLQLETRRGKLKPKPSVGGLATGLGSFYRSYESAWIGWYESPEELDDAQRDELAEVLARDYSCHPVFLPPDIVSDYYDGFCNKTLWPLFHRGYNSSVRLPRRRAHVPRATHGRDPPTDS